MPTYEYRCTKCKKTFEEFQSITAKPLETCKFCSGRVERVISAGGGVIFKTKDAPKCAPGGNNCSCCPHGKD